MAAPTITFPCPFCGRRMGVTAEFLGRQVRCPHCKQVVLAPMSAGPAPAPVASTSAPPMPSAPAPVIQIVSPLPAPETQPTPPREPELPVFHIPQGKEGADSILGEPDESEDEVFGSSSARRLAANPTNPAGTASAPATRLDSLASAPTPPTPLPPVPPPAPATQPPVELSNPLGELEPVSLPPGFAPPLPNTSPDPVPPPHAPRPVAGPQPVPATTPLPQPVASGPAPAVGNPFADFSEPTRAPRERPRDEDEFDDDRPRKKKKRDRDDREERDEREKRPARATHTHPASGGGGGMVVLLVLLGVYALLATGLAVYGLFFDGGGRPDTGHPLSTIPDSFGEFDPATRKKVAQYKFPVDGELPPAQRAGLGETIALGQLEIQPVKIEKRRLSIKTEGVHGETRQKNTDPAFVLTLSIKNTSRDLYIHPMDPAFTRESVGYDKPATRLVVNPDTVFAGGAIPWPPSGNVKRRLEVQQANDYVPLKPGEVREYVVFTSPGAEIIQAVENAKDTMQWRVQVRRGPIEYQGKEIPVTAIVGVDFKASDITASN